jgi:hypothetical protein
MDMRVCTTIAACLLWQSTGAIGQRSAYCTTDSSGTSTCCCCEAGQPCICGCDAPKSLPDPTSPAPQYQCRCDDHPATIPTMPKVCNVQPRHFEKLCMDVEPEASGQSTKGLSHIDGALLPPLAPPSHLPTVVILI